MNCTRTGVYDEKEHAGGGGYSSSQLARRVRFALVA